MYRMVLLIRKTCLLAKSRKNTVKINICCLNCVPQSHPESERMPWKAISEPYPNPLKMCRIEQGASMGLESPRPDTEDPRMSH